MAVDRGLVDLICKSLSNDPIPVRELNQNTSAVLKELSQAGMAYEHEEGPFAGRVITHRSRPEFVLLPIAHTAEYLQAAAEHAVRQASAATEGDPVVFTAELANIIEAAD